jgi:hypothetical protein
MSGSSHGFQLRPRSFGEILDGGIRIWRDHLRVLFPFVALVLLPFQILIALLRTSAQEAVVVNDASSVSTSPTVDVSWTGIAALLVSLVVGVVAGLFVAAAITSFVGEAVLGRTPETRTARRVALARLVPSLGVVVLSVLAILPAIAVVAVAVVISPWLGLLAGILASLGAVWWFVATSFAAPIVVLEHAGAVQALRRSIALVRGNWWFLFGISIVSSLMTGIPTAIIAGIITGLLSLLGGGNAAFAFLWAAVGGTIGAALFTPMSSAISVIAYLDRRVRTEGFDLQRLATSLGTDLPPPPAGWAPPPAGWAPPSPPGWAPPPSGPPSGWTPPPSGPPSGWTPPPSGPPNGPTSWQVPQPSSAPLPPPPPGSPAPGAAPPPWAAPAPAPKPAPAPNPTPWASPGEGPAPAAGPPPHVLPPLDTPPGMWAPPPGSPGAAPDSPRVDAPRVDAPPSDAPRVDAPRVDSPRVDAPPSDAPRVDSAPWAPPVGPDRDADR